MACGVSPKIHPCLKASAWLIPPSKFSNAFIGYSWTISLFSLFPNSVFLYPLQKSFGRPEMLIPGRTYGFNITTVFNLRTS